MNQHTINASAVNRPPRTREWRRTEATQQRILDGAIEVFGTRGFASATMAQIVERSGTSSGSIYHHFHGKDELFSAIHERVNSAVEQRMAAASERLRGLPLADVLAVQVEAYLDAICEHRAAARVLSSGDWPAGFNKQRRHAKFDRFRRCAAMLDLSSSAQDRLLFRIVMALVDEFVVIVSGCETTEQAEPIIAAAVDCVRRVVVPGGATIMAA